MKRILALTLCLVMLAGVFAGCGKKDENDRGPVIRTYMTSDIYNFDPMYAYTDDATAKIMGLIYEGLFRLDSKGRVEKALCKEYKIIEEEENGIYGMQITINETGWSDGRAVSVDDLVYAWKRILDPEFTCNAAAMLFDIKNAKAYKNGDCSPDDVGLYPVDSKVLDIYFEGPIDYDLFVETLCSPMLVPVREDVVAKAEQWASNVAIMVANGPFAVRTFVPGEKMALQRNSYYYRDAEKDADDAVVRPYRIFVDLNASPSDQLTAYNNGELFYLSQIPLISRGDWASKVKTVDLQNVHTYYFNTNNELFANAKVRQALSKALDREAIAELLVFAEAATGLITDGVFNTKKGTSFRDAGGAILSTKGDVEGAKALLKEAGVTSGSFTITIRDNDVDRAIAEYAESIWEDLGFNVSIDACGAKKYTTEKEYEVWIDQLEKKMKEGDFDVVGIDLQMFSSDAFSTLAPFAVGYSGTALNLADKDGGGWDLKPGITGFNNEAYNKLIDEAYYAYDRAARAEKLHEAEKLLMEELPVMPLVVLENAYMSQKLSGFSFDYFGCPEFTELKLKNYELYTLAEEKEK